MAEQGRLAAKQLRGYLRVAREWFYAVLTVTTVTLAVTGVGDARYLALAVVGAASLALPRLVPARDRGFEIALWVDAVNAVIVWWLFGPIVGVDFILFYVVAVSALVLSRRRAIPVILLAVVSELGQIPLHLLAERRPLPLFHPEAQVMVLAEFATGVALRTVAILLMAGLFLAVSRIVGRSEGAQRRSEERFRELFEDAPTAYLTVDGSGIISGANRAAIELLGTPDDPLVGRNCKSLYAANDLGITVAERNFADAQAGRRIRDVELLLDESLGRDRWISLHAEPVRDAEGNIAEIRAALVEVTARRRFERLQAEANSQLESLMQAKDRFIASVSHEIRTPLTGVLGFTETLHGQWSDYNDEERRQFISYIADQSREISFLVEDLLVAARAEINELAVRTEAVDLCDTIRSVIELCGHCDPAFDERVDTTVEGAAAIAVGDSPRVRQILRNLLTNALRYGGDTIRFVLIPDQDHAVVEVRDNGSGLPDEFVDSMFEPYAVANRTAGLTDSVGLGLSVAHKLAELMGGGLHYFRESDETVFRMRLPAAAPSHELLASSPTPS